MRKISRVCTLPQNRKWLTSCTLLEEFSYNKRVGAVWVKARTIYIKVPERNCWETIHLVPHPTRELSLVLLQSIRTLWSSRKIFMQQRHIVIPVYRTRGGIHKSFNTSFFGRIY